MAAFKRLLLLNEEEVERIKAKQIRDYDPSITALARIKDQMDNVLSSADGDSVSNEQKLKLFQNLQNRYLRIRDYPAAPARLASVSSFHPPPTVVDLHAVAPPAGARSGRYSHRNSRGRAPR